MRVAVASISASFAILLTSTPMKLPKMAGPATSSPMSQLTDRFLESVQPCLASITSLVMAVTAEKTDVWATALCGDWRKKTKQTGRITRFPLMPPSVDMTIIEASTTIPSTPTKSAGRKECSVSSGLSSDSLVDLNPHSTHEARLPTSNTTIPDFTVSYYPPDYRSD